MPERSRSLRAFRSLRSQRTFFISLLFLLAASLLVSVFLFERSSSGGGSLTAQNGSSKSWNGESGTGVDRELSDEDEKAAAVDLEQIPDAGYRIFNHRAEQDPQAGKIFLVSFRFSFGRLPVRLDRRMRIISKYDDKASPPFPGWVIAIRPMKTSIRPEVYWQTAEGKGGWYTFERFNLEPMKTYDGTLIVKPEEQMSLFLEEVSESGLKAVSASDVSSSDGFMGGYSLKDVGTPRTNEPIKFAVFLGTVTVSRLLLTQLPESFRVGRSALARFVQGGADAIRERLSENEVIIDYPPDVPEIVGTISSSE